MLVNEKPLRRVSSARDKTLGWPVSTTESFFMDGERQEQEGWDPAKLQASEPDPERMFTSFDRVPRNRWPLFVVAILALLVIGAVASARVPAARDIRRRTIATVSAWLPPLKWPTPPAQPAHAAPVAVAAPTPAPAEAVAAPATRPAVTGVPASSQPAAAPAPVVAAPVAAPAAAPVTAPVAASATAPVAAPATAPAVPEPAEPAPAASTTTAPKSAVEPSPSLSLIPWKETADTASPSPVPPVRKGSAAPAARPRPVAPASTAHRGVVWSPKEGTLVPSTAAASDPAPEILPPSNAAPSRPIAATPAPAARSTSGMASPSQIEPPAFQPPPPERAAPSTEPTPAKDKAPVIE